MIRLNPAILSELSTEITSSVRTFVTTMKPEDNKIESIRTKFITKGIEDLTFQGADKFMARRISKAKVNETVDFIVSEIQFGRIAL